MTKRQPTHITPASNETATQEATRLRVQRERIAAVYGHQPKPRTAPRPEVTRG